MLRCCVPRVVCHEASALCVRSLTHPVFPGIERAKSGNSCLLRTAQRIRVPFILGDRSSVHCLWLSVAAIARGGGASTECTTADTEATKANRESTN